MDTLDVAKPNISGTRRNGKFPPKNDFKRQDPSNSSQILWKNIENHVAPPLNLSEKTFGVKNIQRVWCGKFGGQAFASQLSFGKLYWFWKIYCIPADTFRRGAAVHFQMLARRHGLHNHQFSAPFVFFCFVPMDFCLEHNQKRISENINGWMNDSTLKHTLWSRFGTKETQCDYCFEFGRGFVTNDSDHIVVSFTELWHFSAPDLHLVVCGQAEAKQTQLQRLFPIQVGAQ